MILAIGSSCDDSYLVVLRQMSEAHQATLTLCSTKRSAHAQTSAYGVYI